MTHPYSVIALLFAGVFLLVLTLKPVILGRPVTNEHLLWGIFSIGFIILGRLAM